MIGTEGRLENFGDTAGGVVKVWNSRRSGYREDADQVVAISGESDGRTAAPTRTWSPSSSASSGDGGPTPRPRSRPRAAVAAGYAATMSLRSNGTPMDVPPLDPELIEYFDSGQVR